MNKIVIALAASAAALVSVAGTANAAPWQSINQRQDRLEIQIRQGIRTGALTRPEAAQLTNRLERLEQLERNFRRNGLTMAERRVLDTRFDALARAIRVQVADRQVGYGQGNGRGFGQGHGAGHGNAHGTGSGRF